MWTVEESRASLQRVDLVTWARERERRDKGERRKAKSERQRQRQRQRQRYGEAVQAWAPGRCEQHAARVEWGINSTLASSWIGLGDTGGHDEHAAVGVLCDGGWVEGIR